MIQSQLSPASTESSPAPVRQQQVQLYPHACATCVQRKVKCDKRHPCLACSKSHLQCSYRNTPPPQRRKRKIVEITRAAANQALVDKLRDHEAVLRRAGVSFEPFEETTATVHAVDSSDATNTNTNLHAHASGDGKADDGYDGSVDGEARTPNDIQVAATRNLPSDNEPQTSLFPRQHGILISEYGGNRYYEHALIGLLGQQYKQGPPPGWRQPPRAHEDTELPAFLAGMPDAATETQNTRTEFQHPAHTEMLQYWSIFKQNVHPVTMILHAPTTMDEVINNSADDVCCVASSNPPACITTAKDALKFAICACAVASLKDDDCHRLFGAESKSALLKSVQSATRYALTACSFLRLPNLDLLRAFVLLLTSMLHTTDSPSLWVMLGTAVRLAQAQGLHRDGAALALSPFDTEMRRRLWWYIVSLDARITEVMGAESSLPLSTNTQLPCNVNDSALTPGMTVPPKSGAGASDMMLCLIEYETVRLLQRRDPRVERADHGGKGIGSGSTPSNSHITTVSDLERYLEDNFIRFCDPVVPLHLLTTTVARSLLCKLRQMGHRGQSPPSSDSSRKSFHKQILTTAARTISYDNLIHETPSLSGFLWHVHFWFPWGSPIFVLKIMASLRSADEWDDDVQAAWQGIETLHAHHPEFSTIEADRPEYLVIGDLTIKAWTVREAHLNTPATDNTGINEAVQDGIQQLQRVPQIPPWIATLQARRRIGACVNQYPWQNQIHSTGDDTESIALSASTRQAPSLTSFNTASTFTANSVPVGGLDGGGVNFNIITSPFVGVDWFDWDETRMY